MIQITCRVFAPETKREELLEVLSRLKEPTEASSGCRTFRILQDVCDARAITWQETWDSMSELEEHVSSDGFRRLLPYIDMSLAPPEIAVDQIERLHGMDYLVQMLASRRN